MSIEEFWSPINLMLDHEIRMQITARRSCPSAASLDSPDFVVVHFEGTNVHMTGFVSIG